MNDIYKFRIGKNKALSGLGKIWEYYHFLIEFVPHILYFVYVTNNVPKNSNIIIYIPPYYDDKFCLTSDKFNRTMEHIWNQLIDSNICLEYIQYDNNSIEIPFRNNNLYNINIGYWSNQPEHIYKYFQSYAFHRFDIQNTSCQSYPNIIFIRRGVQNGCNNIRAKTGSNRRSLQTHFFYQAIQFSKKNNINSKIVTLDNMDIVHQIQYFYNANIIIGLHGAGLSNIIFSKPNTHVIECGTILYPCFKNLCEKMNLNYYYTNSKLFKDVKRILDTFNL